MKLLKLIPAIILITNYCFLNINYASAQSLSSEDFQIKIEELEIETSNQPASLPQASEDFRRQGFIIEHINPDKNISRPFLLEPAVFLIRAKAGSSFTLSATINNFKDQLIIQSQIIPFSEDSTGQQTSIDCKLVKSTSCRAVNWFHLKELSQEKFLLEPGSKKKIILDIAIPQDAPEGDYYLNLRLSDFKKPYHYTSTDFYTTVTNNGLIDQNISIDALRVSPDFFTPPLNLPALIDSTKEHVVNINFSNGSPYFTATILNLKIGSPLGLETTKRLPPIILLAGQSKAITSKLDKLPLGPSSISLEEKSSKLSIISLPNPEYFISAALIILAVFFIRILTQIFSKNT